MHSDAGALAVTDKDKFMVIASDGVWEFLSNEEVVDIVKQCNGDAEKAAREVRARLCIHVLFTTLTNSHVVSVVVLWIHVGS